MSKQERFTYENHKVNDNITGDVHSSNRVSVNVLNELNEENEELKKENKAFEHHLSELKGENEILTKENEKLKDENVEIIHDRLGLEEDIDMLLKKNEELKKENRQLKYEIEMLKEVNEQNKALIENRWNEYLKKKEVEEND